MSYFTSSREKQLWVWVFVIWLAIYSTLFIGQPLAKLFADQEIQAVLFIVGMVMIGISIVLHAIKIRPSRFELAIWLGIVAVYIMLFLRLGIPERSHLIEYSVLAIFIHKALIERKNQGKFLWNPSIIAILIAFLIGVLDECIQLFLPDRVFDPLDILFNGIAVLMAIGSSALYAWMRNRIKRTK